MEFNTAICQVLVSIPGNLLHQIDEVATELNFSRSQLICLALERYLEAKRRDELRELLKEGYIANAESSLRICEEFAYADYEAVARYLPPYES